MHTPNSEKPYKPQIAVFCYDNRDTDNIADNIIIRGYDYQQYHIANLSGLIYSEKHDIWRNVDVDRLVLAMLFLSRHTLIQTSGRRFDKLWDDIISLLISNRHIVFMDEDTVGDLNDTWYRDIELYKGKNSSDMIVRDITVNEYNRLLSKIQESGLNIIYYTKSTDVLIRVQAEIDEIEGGSIFRLYVPNGKYQIDQFAALIRLFEKYLQYVEGTSVLVDERKTDHGVLFVFREKGNFSLDERIDESLVRFESFMETCSHDPEQAETMLESIGLRGPKATALVADYSKRYKRIKIDAKHEYEAKVLSIKQRLESELLDLDIENVEYKPTTDLASITTMYSKTQPITINVHGNYIHLVDSIVANELNGDITYTQEDKQLVELFNTYAENMAAFRLKSELELLKDTSASVSNRTTAKQRIGGFLKKYAPVVGDTVVKGLLGYLEKKITG
jgi:hypothetical protein